MKNSEPNLQFCYSDPTCRLDFCREYIQDVIYKNIDINDVEHLWVLEDPEADDELKIADHYLKGFSSYYDLQMVSEEEIRFIGSKTQLRNGITLVFSLNLTRIISRSPDQLFAFAAPIFEAFGYSISDIKHLSESNPFKYLTIENKILPPIPATENLDILPF